MFHQRATYLGLFSARCSGTPGRATCASSSDDLLTYQYVTVDDVVANAVEPHADGDGAGHGGVVGAVGTRGHHHRLTAATIQNAVGKRRAVKRLAQDLKREQVRLQSKGRWKMRD